MCLEVNAADHRILIPFIFENVEFKTHQAIVGTYVVLVRNKGDRPLHELFWMYPKKLLTVGTDVAQTSAIRDVTHEIGSILPYQRHFDPTTRNLTFTIPDPNNPEDNLPNIVGYLDRVPPVLDVPRYRPIVGGESVDRPFSNRHLALMGEHGFTVLRVVLNQPIMPDEAQWLAWRVETVREGIMFGSDSVTGAHIFHKFASPIYVHRTIRETYQSGRREVVPLNDPTNDQEVESWLIPQLHEDTIASCQLDRSRNVDIEFHQLAIRPGPPQERVLDFWDLHGDLRMQNDGPVFPDKSKLEPVFLWKSGSRLEPEHYWRDLGFMMRVRLAFRPKE